LRRPEIELKDLSFGRAKLNDIDVAAELNVWRPCVQVSASVNWKRRSMRSTVEYGSTEVSVARDIHANVASASKIGITEVQSAASLPEDGTG
jgi:hypothetical protein